MSGRKIDERTASIPEVKDIMEAVKKKVVSDDSEEEMSHTFLITYNYVNKFAKMEFMTAQKIIKLLTEKHEIEEAFAINIVNIDPKSIQELHMILEKSFKGKTLNDDQLQDLLSQIEELKSS